MEKIRRLPNNLIFVLILILVSLAYSYNSIFFKKPQSIHKWRQSDCASIALNYYQGGMNFFQPEVHFLYSDNGKTGKACTSEIPILYYSVAGLYKIFGPHDYIFRIFNTLLFFLGLFYLFKLLYYLLKDVFWSIAIAILFFTSPVLVYYGNNFLSNSSGLAFSLIGWYYFVRFYYEKKNYLLNLSLLIFFVAGAFKISEFFSLFAITGIFALDLLQKKSKKIFSSPGNFLIAVISIFLIMGLWLFFAHNYNIKHGCSYFSTTTFPIWEMDKDRIKHVFDNVRYIWLYQYYSLSVYIFLFLCLAFLFVFYKNANKIFIYSIFIIFIEAIAYILLQFMTFADHDYYTVSLFILPAIILIAAFETLKKVNIKLLESNISKILFFGFVVFNVHFAHAKIKERYYGSVNDFPFYKDIYDIEPYLRKIGITVNDTVISIPDNSNATLYLMNQKGWTEYTDFRFNRQKKIRYCMDSAGIQKAIDNGAKYLILNGINQLYLKPYLQSFCTTLYGKYHDILIFNLRGTDNNFSLVKRKVLNIYICDAEEVTDDKKYFRSAKQLFGNGETQSGDVSHSGKYSCKLNVNSPYGMTISIDSVKTGESFVVKVWRKANVKTNATIIASAKNLYDNECEVVLRTSDGWELLKKDLFISKDNDNLELGIYLYNPEKDAVYFDDFEIIRYKSYFE